MTLQKFYSLLALTAIVLVSFAGVCRQIAVSCCAYRSQQAAAIVRLDANADSCSPMGAACPIASTGEHMTIFALAYPSIATDGALPLVFAAALVLAFSLIKSDILANGKLKARFQSLRWRFSNSFTPDFLLSSFFRGILNSKIFA